jgi:hypothetical protein
VLGAAGAKLHLMFAFEWLPLIVKALTTALIVMSASAVAEALGPVWGAIVASLPVSAGPAYVFLAMQHGPDFVADSALHSAAGNGGTGLFLITYAVLAKRMPPWPSLAAAVAMWLAVCLPLQYFAWTPERVCVLNLAIYGPGLVFANEDRIARFEPARALRRRWFELPLRAFFVAAFVSFVVAISSVLGPAATGIAAVFPVSLISLIVILQSRLGGPATAHMASSALAPMLGFGGLLLAMHVTIKPWGIGAALALAMSISVLWSIILIMFQARHRTR